MLSDILKKLITQTTPPRKGMIGIKVKPQRIADGWIIAIEEVAFGAPAAQAGLRAGDVIETCNGESMNQKSGYGVCTFFLSICRVNPGDQMVLGILRDGRQQQVTVTAVQPSAIPSVNK